MIVVNRGELGGIAVRQCRNFMRQFLSAFAAIGPVTAEYGFTAMLRSDRLYGFNLRLGISLKMVDGHNGWYAELADVFDMAN